MTSLCLLAFFVVWKCTQGFRKVDPDRWEFANEGFLAGQRHLLKTIKRRRNVSQSLQQKGGSGACVEVGEFGLEGELERLKRDRNILMAEIVRLRHQQLNSREQLNSMETRLQATEKKQQQMMSFLAKALSNPSFMQQLVHKTPQSREVLLGVEINRKRRTSKWKLTGRAYISCGMPILFHWMKLVWCQHQVCLLDSGKKMRGNPANNGDLRKN